MTRSLRLAALGVALALCACSDSPPSSAPAPAPAAPAPAASEPPPPAAAPAPPPAEAAAATPDAARGKVHYENYCLSCHGARGDGDGPAGLALTPRPARIGERAFMREKTDDYLFQVIQNGGAVVGLSPLMAPWGSMLTDAQIRDVIAYVHSLAH